MRRLGQHFLYDRAMLERIADVSGLCAEDTVVEIGPGPGSLTEVLLARAGRVIAIEVDEVLCNTLKKRFQERSTLEIVHADALKYDYGCLGPFKVVANIPYYITTPLIFRLLEKRNSLVSMTLTVQKEVALRLVARPGGKDYGVLSLALGYVSTPQMQFIIDRGYFRPPPKVDSAVVTIEVLKEPSVAVTEERLFFTLIRTAFSQRRKTIVNSLKSLSPAIKDILVDMGIDPSIRPERLTIVDFACITQALARRKD